MLAAEVSPEVRWIDLSISKPIGASSCVVAISYRHIVAFTVEDFQSRSSRLSGSMLRCVAHPSPHSNWGAIVKLLNGWS